MLSLQMHDSQPGVTIPFNHLDYDRVAQWLDAISGVDPKSDYAFFNASKIYIVAPDIEKKRKMILWVSKEFKKNPNKRWEWMAHNTTLAKHHVKDHDLALSLAKEIRQYTTKGKVPDWARQLDAHLLLTENELEASAGLLLNLLEEEQVTDPQEFTILFERLEKILAEQITAGEISSEEAHHYVDQLDMIRNRFVELNT